MSERLNLIYLSGVDYSASGHGNSAIRGVRHIRSLLGNDDSFGAAKLTVDTFLENPTVKMLVDATEDAELAQQAITEAAEYAQGAAFFEINPEDLELPNPDVDNESEDVTGGDNAEEYDLDGPFSPAAYRTAMALIAMEQGNPTRAFLRCSMLARTTEDASLYQEVQAAILSVFPPDVGGSSGFDK